MKRIQLKQDLVKNINGIRIERIDESIRDKVIEFDAEVHQFSRARLLPHVLAEKDSIAMVYNIIINITIVETNGLLYMILDCNPGGVRIARKLGLDKQWEVPRFFNKFVYETALWNKVYCIHSPNFAIF